MKNPNQHLCDLTGFKMSDTKQAVEPEQRLHASVYLSLVMSLVMSLVILS